MNDRPKQSGEQLPVPDGNPAAAPNDRRGRPAIVALGVLLAFLFIAALASALGADLPFGDDESTKDAPRAALPPEWRHIRPLRPLIPQGEGSGVASESRTGGRSRPQTKAEGRDAAPRPRARGTAQTPVRRARARPRSVPVVAAPPRPRPLRVVRLAPLDRLLDLDARVRLPGVAGSIDLDLPNLSDSPFGRGGLDIDIDIDVDVSIPDIDLPERPPRFPDLPGLDLPGLDLPGLDLPGLPDLPRPDLPGLPGRLGLPALPEPTRSLPSRGSPRSPGPARARLARTGDSSPVGVQLPGRVTSADDPRSDGASEGSPTSRAREPERRPSQEVERSLNWGRLAGLERRLERLSAREGVLEASKGSPTTVAGGSVGSGRVGADCRPAPEDRHDRDCAQEDRDRRRERSAEDDDRGREEADRGHDDDDPGTDPDGA